mmetsp:Transcript_6959/g.28504  ORF Transcript_6959/g.28504 Transcript_6959/m.28504 type:complete len:254 (-) Transcript_6959:1486-2247(-)
MRSPGGNFAPAVYVGAGIVLHALVHAAQQRAAAVATCPSHDCSGCACCAAFVGPVSKLGRTKRRVAFVVTDTSEQEFGDRVERHFRGLATEQVAHAREFIRGHNSARHVTRRERDEGHPRVRAGDYFGTVASFGTRTPTRLLDARAVGAHPLRKVTHALHSIDEVELLVRVAEVVLGANESRSYERIDERFFHVRVIASVEHEFHLACMHPVCEMPDEVGYELPLCAGAPDGKQQAQRCTRVAARETQLAVGV